MRKSKAVGGMGFKELEDFNLAMLAKQGWRKFQDPYSLVSQVLNQKHFSNNHFFQAKMGGKPFYIWRNILAACSLLENGTYWRVGNGREIHIWKENWIPKSTNFIVQGVLKDLDEKVKVHELIDPYTNL